MFRLIRFELQKIWHKRSFLLSVCAMLVLNIFFLWYTSLGDERTPKLSSYKMFQSDVAGMSETEKADYVNQLKQTMDGVIFVRNILVLQNSETGSVFAGDNMDAHPGMFDAYYDLYISGKYLHYTDSLELESLLIDELYEELIKVNAYDSYLHSVQENKTALDGISIFGEQDKNSYSSRNIQKSAADYTKLTTEGIRWSPSKPIVSAMESTWTDILLILLSFLFIGGLITEEKQKGLILITRSTRYGIRHSIMAKLSALFVHCLVSAAVFFLSNYLFFGFFAGWSDVSAKLQSLAPYLESSLPISIWEYLLLSVFTKGLVLFGAGAVLTAVCILSDNVVLPCFTCLTLWSAGWILYRFVPAASGFSIAKYGNLFGALRTENLYGSYLNLNILDFPFSRTVLSCLVTGIVILCGILTSYAFFLKGERFQIKGGIKRFSFPFHPHACLFRHESYKILITNHALVILLVFCALIGYSELTRRYTPSVQEQYYQDIMLRLEGKQTDEKIALIESEAARYQEAFAEIERIDEAVDRGELDAETGSAMKIKWYGVTSFYPAFQRVEMQRRFVSEEEGTYLYDTGYLYLLGIMGDGVLQDFLLLTIGIILAFSHAISMEYQSGAWGILCAAQKGKHGVTARKIAVCLLLSAIFSALPLIYRFIRVSAVFPIHGLLFSAKSIPFYHDFPFFIPAIGLILLKLVLQTASGCTLAMATLAFSGWRKNHVQAIFFGFLLLCVPVILTMLGFGFAQWFSLYPLYSCILG